MSEDYEKWKEEFKKDWLEKFGEPYDPNKKMTEEERQKLYEAYAETFDYDPTMEEAEAKYDDDFNKWLDDLEV